VEDDASAFTANQPLCYDQPQSRQAQVLPCDATDRKV